jgi:putative SOS response-associated peptidase YedK
MCGRFDTSNLTWAEIYDALMTYQIVDDTGVVDWAGDPDVRPTTSQVTARVENGSWVIERMRWGLIPFWRNGKPVKDTAKGAGDGFKLTTFNARVEGVETAATFKAAYTRRRCIVPAGAWYEWTEEQGGKVKHRFARADGQPIWFAGVWDRCKTSDMGELGSFTILTAPSQGWLEQYHTRAPVILDPSDWSAWLNPAHDAKPLLTAVRPERFAIRDGAW